MPMYDLLESFLLFIRDDVVWNSAGLSLNPLGTTISFLNLPCAKTGKYAANPLREHQIKAESRAIPCKLIRQRARQLSHPFDLTAQVCYIFSQHWYDSDLLPFPSSGSYCLTRSRI